jgi:hypothetical protein
MRDQNRDRPSCWCRRYDLILQMYLAGHRTSEIALGLGYSPHRVSMIIHSPLFEEKRAERLRELALDERGGVLDAIRRDALPNLR